MSGLAVRTTARRTREHGDDGTRSALAAAEIANFGVPKEKITKKVFDVGWNGEDALPGATPRPIACAC